MITKDWFSSVLSQDMEDCLLLEEAQLAPVIKLTAPEKSTFADFIYWWNRVREMSPDSHIKISVRQKDK